MKIKSVSAIVPVYNGERYLREALDSIFIQEYSPLEVIIVDDGSTDSTACIAKSYPGVRYFYQENKGNATGRNTGLENSSGELISFLDADDLWVPGKLKSQVAHLEAHPEIGCVIGRMQNFLDSQVLRPDWATDRMFEDDSTAYSLGTLLAHRRVFDAVGSFDRTFYHANDLDWFVRLGEANVQLAIMQEIFLLRRVHDMNISRDQPDSARERISVLKAHLDRRRMATSVSASGVR